MLVLEISNENTELYDEIKSVFPDSEVIESYSFGADTMIQIIIPLAVVLAPTISSLVVKIIENKNVKLKYKGIEISGNITHVRTLLEELGQETDIPR